MPAVCLSLARFDGPNKAPVYMVELLFISLIISTLLTGNHFD